jgi:Tfp pilus assembly protein PilN
MTTTEVMQKLSQATTGAVGNGKKVGGPVWRALTLSLAEGLLAPVNAVSVSIERGSISIAAGSRFLSRIKVRQSGSCSIKEVNYAAPDTFARTVSLKMKELGIRRSSIVLAIPRDWAMVRFASLPAAVKDNLAAAVGYELDRLTPFSPESAYYDFQLVAEENGRVDVMVVAARAGLIDQYMEALKREGISVEKLTTNVSGLVTLCAYAFEAPASICLEVTSNSYEGCSSRSNTLSSSFRGSLQGDQGASKVDGIVAALQPIVASLQNGGSAPPIILASREPLDTETLKRRLKAPVCPLNESDAARKLSPGEGEIPYSACGALLESLWPKAKSLNLLERGTPARKKTPMAISFVLLAFLLALWVPYILLPVQREEKRLAEIERQITLRKNEVRKVEGLKKDIKDLSAETASIDQFKEGRPPALAVLKELTDILPQSTWTTRVRIGDTGVDLEGYAKSASGLLSVLERSRYLRKAEFASPTTRDPRLDSERFVIKTAMLGFEKGEGERSGNGKKK